MVRLFVGADGSVTDEAGRSAKHAQEVGEYKRKLLIAGRRIRAHRRLIRGLREVLTKAEVFVDGHNYGADDDIELGRLINAALEASTEDNIRKL